MPERKKASSGGDTHSPQGSDRMRSTRRTSDPLPVAVKRLMGEAQMQTDADLVRATKLTPATISRYLSGKRGQIVHPQKRVLNKQTLETIEAIARAFNVEPSYFVEYRRALAAELVIEAIESQVIDLEDIEMLLAGYRLLVPEDEPQAPDEED